jgi:branched-chain amino acid transport system ATP-binding protein
MTADLLLDAGKLCAWYGAAQILYDVDLQVRRGEVVALMGRNGAGKSTTLKAIMGLLDKTRGELRFMGRDIARRPPHEIARLGLGFVPEDRRIFSDLTVPTPSRAAASRRRWPDGSRRRCGREAPSSSSPTWAVPTAPAAA